MENYHFLKRITKNDLYKVLRCKYPLSFPQASRRHGRNEFIIFRETIDLLESYDQLLLMLKNDQFSPFTMMQCLDLNQMIERLTYPQNILSEQEYLDFCVFRKISQYLDLIHEFDFSTQVVSLLNDYLGCGALKLCSEAYSSLAAIECSYTNQDIFFDFLESLQPKVLADSSVDEQFDLDFYEEQYELKFKKTLDEHGQIYVFCFDVTIYRSQPQDDDNYLRLYLDYKDQIDKILQKIDGLSTLIHYLVKLEPSQEFGLNLHFVLVLKETKYFSENTFILKLKKELDDILIILGKYVVRNWNDIIRKNFSKNKKAVGLIKKSDLAAVNENWYWIFSCFFAVEQIVKFNADFTTYRVKDGCLAFQQSSLVSFQGLESLFQDYCTFNDIDSQDMMIFSDRKHLSKLAIQYLTYADLIYSEYSYLSIKYESYLWLSSMFIKIEVFCETLKVVKSELVTIPNNIFLEDLSSEEYLKMPTRLGRMWFSLFKSLIGESELIHHWSKEKFCSQNVQTFLEFLNANRIELQELHIQQLNESVILRLNEKLSLLKEELEHQKKSTLSLLEDRLSDLKTYITYLLAKDVCILRIQIEFITQNRNLNKTEQSLILTELLRVGQSAQPLCWLKGYLLRWDQYYCTQRQSRRTYADLTLFFEDQPKLQNVNLTDLLKQYLIKFISRYNEKKKLSKTASELHCSICSCNVFSPKTELRQDILKIETINKDLRRSFMKSYVPYFCFLDLFIPWVEMENGKKIKRYTSGQKPKPKKISIKKSNE